MLGSSGDFSVAGWIGLAVLLGLTGMFVIRRVRTWTQAEKEADAFTLQDLRNMHARGDISDTEFDAMRTDMISGIAARRLRNGPDESKNTPSPPGAR